MDRNYWNARYRTRDLVWSARPNQFLVAEVAGLAPGRVLDLAAGEGRNAVWLAEQGWEATAVDYSDVAIDKARGLATSRGVALHAFVADAIEPLPGGPTFDLVVVAYLQLPPPDRSAALRNAAAAVAPGGLLLVISHDETNLEQGYGGPQDPAVLTGPLDVATALDGFDIEKAERVERVVETADGPRVA
ncbi:MAG: class I SAM-dependent methyltransferase, partial [Acidimicrobiia bacterium]